LKIGSAILISIIFGALLGFSLSYLILNVQIQNLNSKVSVLEDSVSSLQDNVIIAQNNITNLYLHLGNVEENVNNIQNNITSVENDVVKAQSDIIILNSTLENIETGEWNLIFSEITDSRSDYLALINPEGDKLRIKWSMIGTINSKIEIRLYYQVNATLFYSTGSSGIYGSFAVELSLEHPKDYRLWIISENADWWRVEIFDYI
jgi:hypothetical protein